MSYTIIDLEQQTQPDLLCPSCQHCVLDWSKTQYIQPCEHTAFIALDLGFEYVADDFEQTLAVSVDDIHAQELNVWQHIQGSSLACLTIYKMSLGVADYKRYVGFTV
ncbi:hypothetical protein [Acinetobacter rathckeae]|uniref:hypothetical protein n=1 Tax=Acinetobacter rathckeae TaxID=2605272 RepID=UPI0018A311F9|nr:hypothetical protein [Acinetobacter rathckeae]MBF7687239.1 hypothetical protein [Acinetobacter rathckeae]MBF7694408.1 hypothetical protein [Acinetobacter rathckeae]